MTNSGVWQQLTKQRQIELAATAMHARRVGSSLPRLRDWLGWSLVGLGAHLALDPQARAEAHGRRLLLEQRVGHSKQLARP
ncbi:MAG: hypothetical protein ACLQRM_01785 [Acidimicrobiales bacterium]|jgi:hypothetical protein